MHHYIDLPFVKKTKISWILHQKKKKLYSVIRLYSSTAYSQFFLNRKNCMNKSSTSAC